jgi:hypothetical protein
MAADNTWVKLKAIIKMIKIRTCVVVKDTPTIEDVVVRVVVVALKEITRTATETKTSTSIRCHITTSSMETMVR